MLFSFIWYEKNDCLSEYRCSISIDKWIVNICNTKYSIKIKIADLSAYRGERSFYFMNTLEREFLLKHGFEEDTDKKVLSGLFTKHSKFREVNISVNLTEPCMLLARSKEKNVSVEVNSIQENRLILKKNNGRCSTVIMNVLIDEINGCLFKEYGNGLFEFEFEVRDFRYSLHISL